jgi:hypothetical protein
MQRTFGGLLLALSICSVSVPGGLVRGQRAPVPVAVGDTGTRVGDARVADALADALHRAIARESGRLVESGPASARFVLTASVTELEVRPGEPEHEVRIAVSVVVADRGGSVRAMLSGRAGARGDGDPAELTEDALLAAVRSAMRPLGDSLR